MKIPNLQMIMKPWMKTAITTLVIMLIKATVIMDKQMAKIKKAWKVITKKQPRIKRNYLLIRKSLMLKSLMWKALNKLDNTNILGG